METKFSWTKYNNRPHWNHITKYLGKDEHGHWFLQEQDSHSFRPGMEYHTETPVLFLLSHEKTWVAKLFPSGREDQMEIYIDLGHNLEFDAEKHLVTGVDMDLDVIRLQTGATWIEDEDEFIEHTETMNYPEDLVLVTTATADLLLKKVTNHQAPFNVETAEKWGLQI